MNPNGTLTLITEVKITDGDASHSVAVCGSEPSVVNITIDEGINSVCWEVSIKALEQTLSDAKRMAAQYD